MKDKLVRTGHKKMYYRLRSFSRGLLFSILVLAAFSAPVLIAYGVNLYETKAEETKVEESSKQEDEAQVSSYFDTQD